MSTFSIKRAIKRIEEKQQEEIVEEVEELHICPVCGKKYKTKRGIEKHLEKHKGGE